MLKKNRKMVSSGILMSTFIERFVKQKDRLPNVLEVRRIPFSKKKRKKEAWELEGEVIPIEKASDIVAGRFLGGRTEYEEMMKMMSS